MLSRRHLRVKVLQALYAFFQSEKNDLLAGEKELNLSIEKVYDLYISQLLILPELTHAAAIQIEERKNKKLPTQEDLNPNYKFVNNLLIKKIEEDKRIASIATQRKISWTGEKELIRKIFSAVQKSEWYKTYMQTRENNYQEDAEFTIQIFKKIISQDELLLHFYEERSIYWLDDFELVNSMLVKSLKQTKENEPLLILNLFNDEEDDRKFMVDLFRKTVIHSKEYEEMISEKTKNWEVDRIAAMDILIMKMALAEVLNFSNIPIKVSLNEYIDISKRYSTPKSNVFVNGVLDKIFNELKAENKIVKTGRGLMN
ncbi:MAG: transcription antitermination factor NusB [Bacteroidia bacterium]